MKNKKFIHMVIGVCLFMIWFIPFVKDEFLTWQHGNEFIGLHETTGMIGDVNYLKVLDYSKNSARVYYVGNSGNILKFVMSDGEWKLVSWDTRWSKSGTADGFIWPYFYHYKGEGFVRFILLALFIILLYGILWLIISAFIRDKKLKSK